jgi:chromosome segregation ATPase
MNSTRLKALLSESGAASPMRQQLQETKPQHRDTLTSLEAEVQAHQAKLEEASQEIRKQSQMISAADATIALLSSQLTEMQAAHEDVRARADSTRNESTELRKDLKEADREKDLWKGKYERLMEDRSTVTANRINAPARIHCLRSVNYEALRAKTGGT